MVEGARPPGSGSQPGKGCFAGPRFALCGARISRRALPQGRPGAAGGWMGAALRGQKPFLFLRKKKRFLTPKKKLGPVYGGLVVEDGGLRLYALFGDQPRPLRPCHSGTGMVFGSIPRPPGCAALAAECGGRASRPTKKARRSLVPLCAAEGLSDHLGPERGTRRRRGDRTKASPCS